MALISTQLENRFNQSPPPSTKQVPVVDMFHGFAVEDPYRWLENPDDPDTQLWLQQQNRYRGRVLGELRCRRDVRSKVFDYLQTATPELPIAAGGRYFFLKRGPGSDQAALYVKDAATPEGILLVDPAKLDSQGKTSLTLGPVSADGQRIAYLVRCGGEDEGAIEIFDMRSMSVLPDRIPRGRHQGFCPFPQFDAYLYTAPTSEGYVVRLHHIGRDPNSDAEVFRSNQSTGIPGAICAGPLGHIMLRVYYSGSLPVADFFLTHRDRLGECSLAVEQVNYQLDIYMADDRLYALTDRSAPNRRVITASLAPQSPRLQWSELVPETELAIQGMSLVGKQLFLMYLPPNLRSEIRVYDLNGKLITTIEQRVHGTTTIPRGCSETGPAFFRFSSFNCAPTVFEYDLNRRESSLWASRPVPGEPAEIQIRLGSFRSRDGTEVPIFIAHHQATVLSPSTPLMLTAYGGFGICQIPRYSARAALWMELGGVYASACIRGGGELGESWHQAATGSRRQNAFDDFIAAAQWLISQGYTSTDRLAIVGGSNAGLLVGVALTQRPELFRAVICSGPLLDMLRYHLSPFAHPFIREFGSAEDPEAFRVLSRYSPYHAVASGRKYPAVLFVSGGRDTRCDPLHVRKMVAQLQAASKGSEPILLDYDNDRGHAGQLPIERRLNALTEQFCFLIAALRLSIDPSSSRFSTSAGEGAR